MAFKLSYSATSCPQVKDASRCTILSVHLYSRKTKYSEHYRTFKNRLNKTLLVLKDCHKLRKNFVA